MDMTFFLKAWNLLLNKTDFSKSISLCSWVCRTCHGSQPNRISGRPNIGFIMHRIRKKILLVPHMKCYQKNWNLIIKNLKLSNNTNLCSRQFDYNLPLWISKKITNRGGGIEKEKGKINHIYTCMYISCIIIKFSNLIVVKLSFHLHSYWYYIIKLVTW